MNNLAIDKWIQELGDCEDTHDSGNFLSCIDSSISRHVNILQRRGPDKELYMKATDVAVDKRASCESDQMFHGSKAWHELY